MEKGKIKVIIKRPDEKIGHVTNISDKLHNLQNTVGGNIEVVTTAVSGVLIICNEEGKIKGLERNFRYGITFPDVIRGTVIICGYDGEEFADVPITRQQWKKMLEMWGNDTN